ncbi:MAG: hypothetical protein ACHP7N_03995 [Caulobacterales bacterium]
MLTVLITASDDAKALGRLLTALVPGAAVGLVRDVIVLSAEGDSREVAEDAGATLAARGEAARAIDKSRGEWLAGLPLMATLAPDWMALVTDHLARETRAAARLTGPGGFPRLGGKARLEGWLVPRSLAPSAGVVEQDLQRLARRSGVRLRVLAGR